MCYDYKEVLYGKFLKKTLETTLVGVMCSFMNSEAELRFGRLTPMTEFPEFLFS